MNLKSDCSNTIVSLKDAFPQNTINPMIIANNKVKNVLYIKSMLEYNLEISNVIVTIIPKNNKLYESESIHLLKIPFAEPFTNL